MENYLWKSVNEELPPEDDLYYPILDSDGCGDFIQGKIINSDYIDRYGAGENACVITHWINSPIPIERPYR